MPQPFIAAFAPLRRLAVFAGSCLACLTFLAMVPASASEPALPPGSDPGGPAIAVLGEGVDYTRPEIAARLARDGEGDLIAWDFADNDNRPFAASSHVADDIQALSKLTPSFRMVVVREAADDKVAVGRMIAFATQTPARIIVWPGADPKRPDWPILLEALKRFRAHVFVIPAIAGMKPVPNLFMPSAIASEKSAARADLWSLTARVATILAAEPQIDVKALPGRLATR